MKITQWCVIGATAATLAVPLPQASATTASGMPTASAALAQLPRKGRAPMTGYTRERFGQTWTDNVSGVSGGHNGCDTRDDILRRDLVSVKVQSGGCAVVSGVRNDPYTGRRIPFTRGIRTSSAIQIDHLVALGDAWQTGAQSLSVVKRTQLANDPLNLLAVDGPSNERKRDADAASLLPRAAFRCTYVARQIAVKRKYGLWVTTAEGAAMARILQTCPGTLLPATASTNVPAPVHPTPRSTPRRPAAPRRPSPPRTSPTSTYYPNCAAVRAAGRAPLHRGQPGYRSGLDRDGDGVACE